MIKNTVPDQIAEQAHYENLIVLKSIGQAIPQHLTSSDQSESTVRNHQFSPIRPVLDQRSGSGTIDVQHVGDDHDTYHLSKGAETDRIDEESKQ